MLYSNENRGAYPRTIATTPTATNPTNADLDMNWDYNNGAAGDEPFALGTIASAIDNALGVTGAIRQLPVTPQRMKKILKEIGR